jgi:hypothetical protein
MIVHRYALSAVVVIVIGCRDTRPTTSLPTTLPAKSSAMTPVRAPTGSTPPSASAGDREATLRAEAERLRQENERLRGQLGARADDDSDGEGRSSTWHVVEQTAISGMVTKIERGTVLRTASGSLYEVLDITFIMPMEIGPSAIVLSDGSLFKLIVDGVEESLFCRQLKAPVADARAPQNRSESTELIESKIDGDFEGFDFDRVFKLRNGQIWQQLSAKFRHRYRYAPRVIIWRDGKVHRMKVDGIDDTVTVMRLK